MTISQPVPPRKRKGICGGKPVGFMEGIVKLWMFCAE
jgi:hypothetical protein